MPENNNQTLTIAHLSDPHLSSLQGIQWRQLFNKRILGYLSWLKRRRFVHRPELLDALAMDLQVMAPDHIVVTGDLTHIGLQDEFRQSRRWLESLGAFDKVTVIPGNHDAYVSSPWHRAYLHWEPFMLSDKNKGAAVQGEAIFPTVRRRKHVAIIGLSSAVPSPPFMATGKLSDQQLSALEPLLRELKKEGLFRVVMLHHPPVHGVEKRRKRLINIDAFHEIIKAQGAELVLHGHGHQSVENTIEGNDGAVPVVGVPSASSIGSQPGKQAGYNLYEISADEKKWTLNMIKRGYRSDRQQFVYQGNSTRVVDR
ncbi:MAG: metallophosphoesterase [Gammaproteobacteria bacterium]